MNNAAIKTDDLWLATHAALLAGQWSKARPMLEQLAGRHDVRDTLPAARVYGLTGQFGDLIQDRIDAVNRVASR